MQLSLFLFFNDIKIVIVLARFGHLMRLIAFLSSTPSWSEKNKPYKQIAKQSGGVLNSESLSSKHLFTAASSQDKQPPD